jgi:hypothetical protein
MNLLQLKQGFQQEDRLGKKLGEAKFKNKNKLIILGMN